MTIIYNDNFYAVDEIMFLHHNQNLSSRSGSTELYGQGHILFFYYLSCSAMMEQCWQRVITAQDNVQKTAVIIAHLWRKRSRFVFAHQLQCLDWQYGCCFGGRWQITEAFRSGICLWSLKLGSNNLVMMTLHCPPLKIIPFSLRLKTNCFELRWPQESSNSDCWLDFSGERPSRVSMHNWIIYRNNAPSTF